MSLLGHRVRDMRKRAGLSQTELAKLAGVGQSTVSEVEHGKISPKTVSAIAALARQFDTTADFLLGLTDDPSPAPRRQLPEYGTELLEIIRELSPARGEELLEIARVLYASYMRRSKLEWLANALESTDNQTLRELSAKIDDPRLIVTALEAALRTIAKRQEIATTHEIFGSDVESNAQ